MKHIIFLSAVILSFAVPCIAGDWTTNPGLTPINPNVINYNYDAAGNRIVRSEYLYLKADTAFVIPSQNIWDEVNVSYQTGYITIESKTGYKDLTNSYINYIKIENTAGNVYYEQFGTIILPKVINILSYPSGYYILHIRRNTLSGSKKIFKN